MPIRTALKSVKGFILLSLFLLFSCAQDLPLDPQKKIETTARVSLAKTTTQVFQGRMETGGFYMIQMPDQWNGDLVMYAHGYVSPTEPVVIPVGQLYLPDGSYLPDIITDMGYAFATTSYRANGMVVQDAIIDLVELGMLFKDMFPDPKHNYLVGASEGGLITANSLESKRCYSGGLAVCGPVGNFVKQINYMGDFRVLFDYFFPGIMPGSAIQIPQELMDNWDSVYQPKVIEAISANPDKTLNLLFTAKAPFDPDDIETIGQTVLGLLWYNVFATNDLAQRCGGNPYENRYGVYHSLGNNKELNARVQRFTADPQAIAEATVQFGTNGMVREPLVTMHTAGDPIVPFWHEQLYRQKIAENGNLFLFNHIPVGRYGHCNFTKDEVLQAFELMVAKVLAKELLSIPVPVKTPDRLTKQKIITAK